MTCFLGDGILFDVQVAMDVITPEDAEGYFSMEGTSKYENLYSQPKAINFVQGSVCEVHNLHT